jgi:hypothetical protein
MKINIYIPILILLLFSACRENIELDLNSSNPQIVVEGSVAVDGPTRISITKSVNFNDNNSFPTVSNATVIISDNIGKPDTLKESKPGIYTSSKIIGIVGRTYSLTVKANDKTITSSGTIPNPVKFDSLNVMPPQGGFGGGGFGGGNTQTGTLYFVRVKFNDPENETNYYRFVEYINSKPTGNIYVYDDRLNNGKTNDKTLLNFTRYLVKGDTVTVEMQCIDKAVYEYFNSFGNLGMGPSSSTPANPYTNLNGAVLGFFSAHTVERKQVIVK